MTTPAAQRSRPSLTRTLALLIAATTVNLAGCGGSSDSSPPSLDEMRERMTSATALSPTQVIQLLATANGREDLQTIASEHDSLAYDADTDRFAQVTQSPIMTRGITTLTVEMMSLAAGDTIRRVAYTAANAPTAATLELTEEGIIITVSHEGGTREFPYPWTTDTKAPHGVLDLDSGESTVTNE